MNFNIKSIVLIGVALVVAGITAVLARSLISAPEPTTTSPQIVERIADSKMKILVASINMPVGHFIKPDDLVWQSWPDETVHESYVQQDSNITLDSFNGAVVRSATSSGEPILENRMVKPGNRGFMAAVLPTGKRAISIRITATTGNAGFVFPGDRVDILLTHQVAIKDKIRKKARVSETILRNIRILAINQRTNNPTHTPAIGQTATLEVTPKEAEAISLAKNIGELSLILRSLGTEDTNDVQTVTWDSDVSHQISAGSSGGGAGNNASVEVFRGGVKETQKFSFNQLMKQALNANNNSGKNSGSNSGQNETNDDGSEETDQ
ncbi:MAG: Flp pilus assembly protein CpaB [Emcibacter sp.]|nr:Flp pilus assembly protein CpaB [Emcibacter sp.]